MSLYVAQLRVAFGEGVGCENSVGGTDDVTVQILYFSNSSKSCNLEIHADNTFPGCQGESQFFFSRRRPLSFSGGDFKESDEYSLNNQGRVLRSQNTRGSSWIVDGAPAKRCPKLDARSLSPPAVSRTPDFRRARLIA